MKKSRQLHNHNEKISRTNLEKTSHLAIWVGTPQPLPLAQVEGDHLKEAAAGVVLLHVVPLHYHVSWSTLKLQVADGAAVVRQLLLLVHHLHLGLQQHVYLGHLHLHLVGDNLSLWTSGAHL